MKKSHNIITSAISLTIIVFMNGCGGGTANDATSAVDSESAINTQETIIDSVPYDIPPIDASIKQVYLDAINKARSVPQNCGEYGIKNAAPALTWDDALYKAAAEHSEDMAESNTFSHTGSYTQSDWTAQVMNLKSGSTKENRIENNGYKNWKKIGENIAAGSKMATVQDAIDAWIESDGHCANLMNPEFKNIGMGHFEKDTSTYIHYWTQNFGMK